MRDYDHKNHSLLETPDGAIDNLEFPSNYIEYVFLRNNGHLTTPVLSAHPEVIDELIKRDVKFAVVLPSISFKERYLERLYPYSDDKFIKSIIDNYEGTVERYIKAGYECFFIDGENHKYLDLDLYSAIKDRMENPLVISEQNDE